MLLIINLYQTLIIALHNQEGGCGKNLQITTNVLFSVERVEQSGIKQRQL